MRAIIAVQQATARERLRDLLEEAGVNVVGEASAEDEAEEHIRTLRPDLVVIDGEQPDLERLAAIQKASSGSAPVVLLVTPVAPPVNGNAHSPKPVRHLMVKDEGHIHFLEVEEIQWVEAEGNYVRVYAPDGDHLLRRKIGDLEAQLDPSRFVRIHRSAIVNVGVVDRLVPWFSGGYLVRLRTGKELKLSRGYAAKLFDSVGVQF